MKQFMQLQPPKWKEIYSLYLNIDITQFINAPTDDDYIKIVKEYLLKQGFDEDYSDYMSRLLIKSFNDDMRKQFIECEEDAELTEARLTLLDIQELKARLLHEPSPEIRRLLVSYAVYARANPHHSFWIRNDKKVINFLASIQKMRVQDQILLTNRLHTLYNLDMRVVGSKQPIPCFKLSWQAEQPEPDTPENPLVLIGPLNPAIIKSFAEQLPYEEEATEETTNNE